MFPSTLTRFEAFTERIDNLFVKKAKELLDIEFMSTPTIVWVQTADSSSKMFEEGSYIDLSVTMEQPNWKSALYSNFSEKSIKSIAFDRDSKIEINESYRQEEIDVIKRKIDIFLEKDTWRGRDLSDYVNQESVRISIICGDMIQARLNCRRYFATSYKDKAWLFFDDGYDEDDANGDDANDNDDHDFDFDDDDNED